MMSEVTQGLEDHLQDIDEKIESLSSGEPGTQVEKKQRVAGDIGGREEVRSTRFGVLCSAVSADRGTGAHTRGAPGA